METKHDERRAKVKGSDITRFELRPEDFARITARLDRISELSLEGANNLTVSQHACRQCVALAADIRNAFRNLVAVKEEPGDESETGE